MNKWHPIATVPKDGTVVTGGWFAWDEPREPVEHVEHFLRWEKSAQGLIRKGYDVIFTPTHWKRQQ